MAFVGTALSWIMIHHFGRRTIFLSGITFLAALHYIIGGLAVVSEGGNGNAKWGQAALTIIWVFGKLFATSLRSDADRQDMTSPSDLLPTVSIASHRCDLYLTEQALSVNLPPPDCEPRPSLFRETSTTYGSSSPMSLYVSFHFYIAPSPDLEHHELIIQNPYMLNPTQWNLQGKTNFVWAPLATICVIWGYFRLPEMKVSISLACFSCS